MPFRTPTFNLECDVFTGSLFTVPARARLVCSLSLWRRSRDPSVQVLGVGGGVQLSYDLGGTVNLLLPRRADVRSHVSLTGPDGIECPPGSGRRYSVQMVDDVGRGYPNEYRLALIEQTVKEDPGTTVVVFWPTPIP